MKIEVKPIRGMKDLFGINWLKYQFIINTANKVAVKYGYQIIETPIVESTDVFQRAIGDETDVVSKEMYSFIDKGNERITLRPEGTAGVIRSIVTNNMLHSANVPLKLMYYGPMFRYDRPQKGRYRQFHQLGFEHLENKNPYIDAITIALAYEILMAIGISDCKIYINTLGDTESRGNYIKALVKYFERYEDKLSEGSKIRLRKNPLRILDSKDSVDKELAKMAPKITDYLNKQDVSYFDCVCNALTQYGIPFEIDNLLVRGLDYYNQTTFEIKNTVSDFQDALGGGGRYDNLLKMFGGQDVSGIGFALGIERLMLILDDSKFQSNTKKIGVIPVSENEINSAFELFRQLHTNGIATELILVNGNLRKKVEVANKMECSVLLILGESELKSNNVSVTFLNSELRNKTISRNNIVNFLKYNLKGF